MNDFIQATTTIETNWGAEEWRAPSVEATDKILFSECGRILGNIDYRSHYFRIVQGEYSNPSLLVKHGGGEERITGYFLRKLLPIFALLNSDSRYLALHAIFDAHYEGKKLAQEKTANIYRTAFVEGRLKKRKVKAGTKIWIEPKPMVFAEAK